jgi:hypothetical protein
MTVETSLEPAPTMKFSEFNVKFSIRGGFVFSCMMLLDYFSNQFKSYIIVELRMVCSITSIHVMLFVELRIT